MFAVDHAPSEAIQVCAAVAVKSAGVALNYNAKAPF
jgi:hypothetical protein